MRGAIMNNLKTDYIIYVRGILFIKQNLPKGKMCFICVRDSEIENVKYFFL